MNTDEYLDSEGVDHRGLPYSSTVPAPYLPILTEPFPNHYSPFQDGYLPGQPGMCPFPLPGHWWSMPVPFSVPSHTTVDTTNLNYLAHGGISAGNFFEPSLIPPTCVSQIPASYIQPGSVFVPEIDMTSYDQTPQFDNNLVPFMNRSAELSASPISSYPASFPCLAVPVVNPPAAPSTPFPVHFDQRQTHLGSVTNGVHTIQQGVWGLSVSRSWLNVEPGLVSAPSSTQQVVSGNWNPSEAAFAPQDVEMADQSDHAGVCKPEPYQGLIDIWEAIRPKFVQLYIHEAQTLETTMMIIKHICGFVAS